MTHASCVSLVRLVLFCTRLIWLLWRAYQKLYRLLNKNVENLKFSLAYRYIACIEWLNLLDRMVFLNEFHKLIDLRSFIIYLLTIYNRYANCQILCKSINISTVKLWIDRWRILWGASGDRKSIFSLLCINGLNALFLFFYIALVYFLLQVL